MQRDSVGAASGLKLSYAGLTKGFTALCATMLGAAEREGLTDALRAELARNQPNYLKHLDRFVPAMRPKAYRFVDEMRQIAEFVGSPDDGATIYERRRPALPANRRVNLTLFRAANSNKVRPTAHPTTTRQESAA